MATNAGAGVVSALGLQLLLLGLGFLLVVPLQVRGGPGLGRPRSAGSVSAPAGSPGISIPSRLEVSCDGWSDPPGCSRGPRRVLAVLSALPSQRPLLLLEVGLLYHLFQHVVAPVVMVIEQVS